MTSSEEPTSDTIGQCYVCSEPATGMINIWTGFSGLAIDGNYVNGNWKPVCYEHNYATKNCLKGPLFRQIKNKNGDVMYYKLATESET